MRTLRPFTLCAIVCVAAALVLAGLILRPALIANSIRNELRELRPGPFSAERLRKWAADHGGTVSCDNNSKCEADASLFNWPLYVLGLAPKTMFAVSISTTGGNLTQTVLHLTDLQYSAEPLERREAATTLGVHFAEKGTAESRFGVGGTFFVQKPNAESLPKGVPPIGVTYSVDLSADSRARALAYDINVWCLARIGGCDGPQQAPGVWALRKSDTR